MNDGWKVEITHLASHILKFTSNMLRSDYLKLGKDTENSSKVQKEFAEKTDKNNKV